MKQSTVPISNASLRLQERYPQLVILLDDLDGLNKFILNLLRKFDLVGLYSPEDIIGECFLRWHNAVQGGKSIPVLAGWLRLTAHHVVREYSRKRKKDIPCEPAVLAELIPETYEDAEEENEQHQVVTKALQALPEEKRALLELRFVRNLSWENIAEEYARRGEKASVPTLRKRGQRAMEELREVFLDILQNT